MTYPASVLVDSPVGFWPLTETTGTAAADATGNGHTGTYQRAGMVGGRSWGSYTSPNFTGTSTDWISIPASAALSSHAGATGTWSMDCLVYDDGVTGSHRNILTVSNFPGGYEIAIRRELALGELFVSVSQDVGSGYAPDIANTTIPSALSPNAWHHISVTYDRYNQHLAVYVDGCVVSSILSMSYYSSFTNNAWRIGGRADTSDQRWDGSMSHVAIYSSVLSAPRVMEHAIAAGITPPCVAVQVERWSTGFAWSES